MAKKSAEGRDLCIDGKFKLLTLLSALLSCSLQNRVARSPNKNTNAFGYPCGGNQRLHCHSEKEKKEPTRDGLSFAKGS